MDTRPTSLVGATKMPEEMTVAGLLSYLADVGVLDGHGARALRDALAELGLYPERRLSDIEAVYWPDEYIKVGTQVLRLSTNELVTILSGPYPNMWGAYYECRTAEGIEHLRDEWLAIDEQPERKELT